MSRDYISGVDVPTVGPALGVKEGSRDPTAIFAVDMGRFPLDRTTATTYNVWTPNFSGRIIGAYALCEEVTTDSDADATITPRIDTTNTTGGVITLADTGDATNDFDTVDEIFQGTLITAANTFTANQEIGLRYAVTNAFSDGVARVYLIVEKYTD